MFWKRLICYFVIWNHIVTSCALANWSYRPGIGRHTTDLLAEDLMEQSQQSRLSKSGDVSLSPRIKLPKGITEEDLLPLKKQTDLFLDVIDQQSLPSLSSKPKELDPEPSLSKVQAALQEAREAFQKICESISQKIEALYKSGPDLRIRVDQAPLPEQEDTLGLRLRAFQGTPSQEDDTQETLLGQTILDPDSFKGILLPGMKAPDTTLRWEVGGLQLEINGQGNMVVCGGQALTSVSLETSGSVVFQNAVKADWLAVKSAQCSVYGSLEVENLHLSTQEVFFLKGRHAHLQARHMTVHDGDLQIGRKSTLSLLKGGTLDLQNHRFINEHLLEALEGASLIKGNHVINQGHMVSRQGTLSIDSREIINDADALMSGNKLTLSGNVVNAGRMDVTLLDLASPQWINQGQMVAKVLKGWMGEGQNQGDLVGTDSLELTLKGRFHNDHHMGSHRHLKLTLQDQFLNQGDLISGGVLRIQGEGILENHWTIQGGKWGTSLSMNALENHSLIQSHGNLLLSPGHHFLNHQGAWIHALGNTTLSGKGEIRNDGGKVVDEEPRLPQNPRLEGAGFSLERHLTFQHFTGSLLNAGSWMTGGKAHGKIPYFKNQGLWQAGFSALAVERFENLPGDLLLGGKILGNGQWTLKTAINRSIIRGDDLEITVQDSFEHHPEGALQGITRLAFSGTGHLDLRGTTLSEDTLLLNPKTLETSGKITAPHLTVGENVTRWVNGEQGEIEVGTLSFPGLVTQAYNQGQIKTDVLAMTGSQLTNEGSLILKEWTVGAGRLLNQPDGTLTIHELLSLQLNSLMNEGEAVFKKGFRFDAPHEALRLSGLWKSEGLVDIKAAQIEVTGDVETGTGSTLVSPLMTLGKHGKWQDRRTSHHLWTIQKAFRHEGQILLNGSLGIKSPHIDITGKVHALKGSSIAGTLMILGDHGRWLDGGTETLWNIQDTFRNDGKMEMNHWHLLTGKQGYHHGSLLLKGNALIEGEKFYHKGNTWAKGNITAIMSKEFDQIGEMSAEGNINLDATILFDYPYSKTKAVGELLLTTSYPLTGYWEGTQHFSWQGKYSATYPNMVSSGTLISPTRTTLKVPRDFDHRGKAELNHLSLDLSYGHQLINTGEMLLPNPVKLGQGGLFLNRGTMEIGMLDSVLSTPGKMTCDPLCEFMENYGDWTGHMFQHMTNEGNLLLSGGAWRIRGTLYNKGKGILRPQSGVHVLYNGFGNEGTILAPHGMELSSLNPKHPLLLKGIWDIRGKLTLQSPELEVMGKIYALAGSTLTGNRMILHPGSLWHSTGTGHHFWHLQQSFKNDGEVLLEGSLGIRSPKIDIGGQIQALKGSSILGQEMTVHPKGIFKDGGDKTLWNIQDTFRNDGKMEMNHWHLMTGKQGYHYGSLILGGNARLEGQSFYHKGNTWAKGNITAIMSKEFDQIGEMSADGSIHLDATILFDYPYSKTKAAEELVLITSYPLTGYWEGTQHFSWQGKYSATYPTMVSSGTMVSPTRTTLKVPRDFDHRGKAELNHLSLDLSYGHQWINSGEMLLPNPVKLGQDAQLVNKGKMRIGKLDPLPQKTSVLTYDPLLNKADFDRDYIETTLLPHIRKIVGLSYTQYKDYQSFVPINSGAGYKAGMDLNKYWQEGWLSHPYWGKKAKEHPPLTPYLFNGYPSFSGHLFQHVTNEGELMLSGEQYQVRGTLFNKKGATLIHRGGVDILHNVIANEGTFYAPDGMQVISKHKQGTLPFTGTWKSDGKMHLVSHKVVNKGILLSPKETYVRAQWGLENEGKAHLHHLWMNVAPGNTIINHQGAELLLTDPWYLGDDFNLVNKGNMAIGKMDPPSTKASRLFLNPQSMVCTCTHSQTDDDYLKNCFLKQHQIYFNSYNGTKDTLETINLKVWNLKPGVLPTRDQVTQRVYDLETGRGVILPYHPMGMFRYVTNEGNLLLGKGNYAIRGQFLNASKAIWSIGSEVHLQANPQVIVNKSLIKFLGDSEIQASTLLVFQGEWQGLKALSFIAPALDNSVGKVRSKGILSLTSTQGDILVGQAQKVMRPVRELTSGGYQYVSAYWEQYKKEGKNKLWLNPDKPRSYPYTITGGGSLTNGEYSYQHLTNNEALFQSGTGIKVSAKGKLLNHFGLMHSQGFMTLLAGQEIDNYSGIIQAQGDMLVQAPLLQNRLSEVMIDRLSDYWVSFRGDQGGGKIRWQHPASDPALIASTGGNLHFKINSGRNHGSRILGAKNVLFEQGGKTSSTPSSFQATSAFMSKNVVNWRGGSQPHQTYTAWNGYYPSLIQGGNTVQVVMPGVSWSQEGMMNAPVISLHLQNFDLNAHLERIGIQTHSVPDTHVRPFTGTLIIDLGKIMTSNVVKMLNEGDGMFSSSHQILSLTDQGVKLNPRILPSKGDLPTGHIVRVRGQGESLSSSPWDLSFLLGSSALQGSLMQALASIAGTQNLVKEFSQEGQMIALHRQASKLAQGKGELTERDLKNLDKSLIAYVAKTIGGIQTLVAQLYLSSHDVNTHGLELASLTGDDVAVHTEESMNILGSIYGENQVTLTGKEIHIERPEIRFKKWVEESSTTSSIVGSMTKTTKLLVEFVLAGEGGKVGTGKQGGINIVSEILLTKGAQLHSGQKGTRIYTSRLFHDQPFITTEHLPYEVSEGMMGGGEHTEKGFVRKDTILPSHISSTGSLEILGDGAMILQAPRLTSEQGNIGIRSKGNLSFPGVKAVVEDVPTLSTSGTKIEKTVGSQEIGDISQIKAPKGQVILESIEGDITGVRPNILSLSKQIKAKKIDLMEEIDFRKTLQRQQQTFTVASSVDPGLMMVMGAAITVATGGVGSGSLGATFASAMGITAKTSPIIFAMVSTGANAIVNKAILSTIVNQGNLGEMVKEMTSKEALQSLGIEVATAGITQKLGLFHPGQNAEFFSHVQYQAQKALVNVAVSSALKGGDMQDILQKAGTQAIINAFASYGAARIGETFDPEKSVDEYLSHKVSHGVLGGLTGFALEGDLEGVSSGVMGAIVSEVVAEQMVDRDGIRKEVNETARKEGWAHDQERIEEERREKLQVTIDKAKLVTGVLALLSRQNVDVSLQASANALENNFINHATGKILEEQRKAYAEKLYYALDTIQDKLVGGMSWEQAQTDLMNWKDHMIEGILGYGDLWQENGKEIARFIKGNERLEYVLGTGGKITGTAFGLAMTMYRGKPGGKIGKPNRTLQGLDLPVSKAAQHVWISRVNEFKKQQARNGHKGSGGIKAENLVQTIGDNRFLQEFYVQDLLQTVGKNKTGRTNAIRGLDLATTGAENRFLHEMYVQELRGINQYSKPTHPLKVEQGNNPLNIKPQKIERSLGTITESGFLNAAERYLGKDYVVYPKGRYVSKDGLRQIRYGNHETRNSKNHHAHFEAYDKKGGNLEELGRTEIVND